MSHSASDGIGNRLYLLIPPALSFSLSLSLALSHSTPPLIHLLRTLLNISPNPIFLFSPIASIFFLSTAELLPPSLSSQLDSPLVFCSHLFLNIKLPPPRAPNHSLSGLDSCTYSHDSAHISVGYHIKTSQQKQETRNVPHSANMLLCLIPQGVLDLD